MTVPAGSPVTVPATAPVVSPAGSEPAAPVEPSAGVVPYWTVIVLAAPRALAVPSSCADDVVTFAAAPVVTVGGSCTSARTIAFGVPMSRNQRLPSGPETMLVPS